MFGSPRDRSAAGRQPNVVRPRQRNAAALHHFQKGIVPPSMRQRTVAGWNKDIGFIVLTGS